MVRTKIFFYIKLKTLIGKIKIFAAEVFCSFLMHEWVDHNFTRKIAKLATTKAAETFEASAKFGNCKVLAKICIKLHLFGLIKNSEEDEIWSQ